MLQKIFAGLSILTTLELTILGLGVIGMDTRGFVRPLNTDGYIIAVCLIVNLIAVGAMLRVVFGKRDVRAASTSRCIFIAMAPGAIVGISLLGLWNLKLIIQSPYLSLNIFSWFWLAHVCMLLACLVILLKNKDAARLAK